MKSLRYLLDRMKEPGSIRSLVLVLFLVRGQVADDAQMQAITDLVLVGLGLVSFWIPEASTKVESPPPASEAADSTVDDAKQALADVQAKLDSVNAILAKKG